MIRKADENNLPSLSALYLLTVEYCLWQIMRNHISKNNVTCYGGAFCTSSIRNKTVEEKNKDYNREDFTEETVNEST